MLKTSLIFISGIAKNICVSYSKKVDGDGWVFMGSHFHFFYWEYSPQKKLV